MYKVVNDFRDVKNDNHLYRVGDDYPVAGYKPTKARIEELAKGKNRLGKVFIEEVLEDTDKGKGQTPVPENDKNESAE